MAVFFNLYIIREIHWFEHGSHHLSIVLIEDLFDIFTLIQLASCPILSNTVSSNKQSIEQRSDSTFVSIIKQIRVDYPRLEKHNTNECSSPRIYSLIEIRIHMKSLNLE